MVAIRDDERLLNFQEVIERTRLSRATIYRFMRKEGFPLPLKMGKAAIRWRSVEVAEWLESRIRATGDLGKPIP